MNKCTRRKSNTSKLKSVTAVDEKQKNCIGLELTEFDRSAVFTARKLLKRRLYGYDVPSEFWLDFGLEDQKRQLINIFEQCIKFGESNSVLVIGPRGSGKTKLIEAALKDLKESASDYFVVYLNGLLQTDDRLSLQEIARQLKLENVIGDKVIGSFAENLAFILDSFRMGGDSTRSVIIILEEFDLFAQHKNQSLIYNLLDVSRSKYTPLAVVGVTCRLDVIELLEKRVKSRYSRRSILTFSQLNFEEYIEMLRSMLKLPDDFESKRFKCHWNKEVNRIMDEKVTREAARKHFNTTKDIRSLALSLAQSVSKVSAKAPFLTSESLVESFKTQEVDGKIQLLKGLSVLELCLIVAMKHVREKRSGEPFNFDMLFKEYQAFVLRRSSTVQRFDKMVALKAFEHLLALEIVKPLHSISSSSLPKDFQPVTLLVEDSQVSDVLLAYQDCPTDLQQWGTTMFV